MSQFKFLNYLNNMNKYMFNNHKVRDNEWISKNQ